ncbi:MAG: glycoside hydrolase family 88 protein [Bacteroidaceae bacterium]|nr:glycoside hydrolase family 88 protein [Bacteroidaceae bacterium]
MKQLLTATLVALACPLCVSLAQQVQNDATAPLHLMRPAYKYPYGVPQASEVKATMDRVKNYLEATTFAELDKTGRQLRRGDFRLTSYEWGVTYSAMLRAGELTGDTSYTKYAADRMLFLAEQAPKFKAWLDKGEQIDPLMRQVVSPAALDDAGAISCAMMKYGKEGLRKKDRQLLDEQIERYYDYIANKQYRYKDGQFARMRPVANTVWLDDMFMGIPALALHGNVDEALRQFQLFHEKMWVPTKKLYRHGWVEPQKPVEKGGYLPSFFWGRANGWALLTACELLDVREDPMVMRCFKEHLAGLMPLQDFDGAWHQLLDDNQTYLETSCTAIYCYCLAHAINKGWIEPEQYVGQTLLAWHYVNAHVNQQGQVEGTCVGTGLAFDPAFYAYRPVNNYAAHGYGPVLWAGAEVYRLVCTLCLKTNDSAVHYYPEDPGTDEPIFEVK